MISGKTISTRLKWLCLLLSLTLVSCSTTPEAPVRKEMPLEKYGFHRTQLDEESFEFLMGNGEMGGRIAHTGLGLEKLWFADYWKNPKQRQYLPGLLLLSDELAGKQPNHYESELNIAKALCSTHVAYDNQIKYTAELFFSFKDDDLLALQVKNESTTDLKFNIKLPYEGFDVQLHSEFLAQGENKNKSDYNDIAWALRSNLALHMASDLLTIIVRAGQTAELIYSVDTPYDNEQFVLEANQRVNQYADFDGAYQAHAKAWHEIISTIGAVIIPDSDYAKWFYRSIYTNYATAGSKHFLAAETQFAYPEEDWDMHAFTYGHGSWAGLSFLQLGDSLRARRTLQWLYQPEALKENVHILIPDTGKLNLRYRGAELTKTTYLHTYPQDAFAFAHEQTDFGVDITYPNDAHWDMQFHLNGFASSLFHRYATLYDDPQFEKEVVYPVIKGTANFWKALIKKDSTGYYLPSLLSLSENIMKPSVLDAVLAAKWTLYQAEEYQKKFQPDIPSDYKTVGDQLPIPQNDTRYLEYLGDTQTREGGGYFGIRASAYLGFPLLEQLDKVDKKKARITLDDSWKRNHSGKGMISFIANWFALTECYMQDGNKALEKSSITLGLEDESGNVLYEAFAYKGDSVRAKYNPYFLTGYSSFSLVPIAMMLQSYNETLYFFPAIPDAWKDVAFYDLPAEGGYKISGVYRSKNDFEVWIRKDGRTHYHILNQNQIKIADM